MIYTRVAYIFYSDNNTIDHNSLNDLENNADIFILKCVVCF